MPLLLLLAKQLHPHLFGDVDLIEKFKYYYKTFYDYDLSTEETEKYWQVMT